jgi:hypothetical protein
MEQTEADQRETKAESSGGRVPSRTWSGGDPQTHRDLGAIAIIVVFQMAGRRAPSPLTFA